LFTIVVRGNIDIRNTQIHDRLLSWHDTGPSIKSGDVKLVLWEGTEKLYFLSKILYYK